MVTDYQKLVERFKEIKEAFAQAKTLPERAALVKSANETLRLAKQQVAELRSKIALLKLNSKEKQKPHARSKRTQAKNRQTSRAAR